MTVDEAWLRNLAAARYREGSWLHPRPDEVNDLVASRVAKSPEVLQAAAEDHASTLSEMTAGRYNVRVLPLSASQQEAGFLLLLGRSQITVRLVDKHLEATLITVEGFARVPRSLHRFAPLADPFGAVAWRMDDSLIMTDELIIKRLFEDLSRAAHEAGELNVGG